MVSVLGLKLYYVGEQLGFLDSRIKYAYILDERAYLNKIIEIYINPTIKLF